MLWLALLLSTGCATGKGQLVLHHSEDGAPTVPVDPKGVHQVTVTFVIQNVGDGPVEVTKLRSSISATTEADPRPPCDIEPGELIRIKVVAKSHHQKVTRRVWIDTPNESLELRVLVDPQKLRAAVGGSDQPQ